MKNLNDILKQTGWRDATPPENGPQGVRPDSAPAPDLAEEADVCPLCGGAGYVRRPVRLGHPDFGRAFPCQCVENERQEDKVARLQRYSNLGPLARLAFENLSPHGRSPNALHQERFADAVAASLRFTQDPSGWLVFTGPSGCGKTHLAAAIAGRSIKSGCAALFMVVPDLLDHLRSAYRPGSEMGYDELFEMLKSAPLLVLDDFGVQSSTPWAQEKLFQLLNHRYNARIPTVFTTNLSLDAFDPRLRSRLSDPDLAQVYHFESGADGWSTEIDALELPLLHRMTFKTFDARLLANDPEELKYVQNAHRQAMTFAQEPKDWLVIAGATGRGKTRLAAAVGNFCRDSGMQVMFVVVPDLLDSLRSSYDPGNPKAFDEIFERVRNVPLLILDDLGSQSGTAWAEEKLFQLVNHRYNACLPTVITTNLTIGDMESRLASRLTDPQVSTILLMGRFDFWGKGAAGKPAATRGRPRRS